jgi:hypothetical protein
LHHQFNIALGKSLNFREFVMQVVSEARNDACAPALSILTSYDQFSDVPVEAEKLSIDCPRGAILGVADAGFDVAQEA